MTKLSNECVVIGAGVIGLAIAARLSASGFEVILLEREYAFGTITSARNSEVIHAGIYYQPDSLKAQLCVNGKQALYAYCDERHINYRRCGKLIVATNAAQLAKLTAIRSNAVANGVADLQLLTPEQAQALEPALYCTGALYSPSTGIIDSHGLMLALLGDAENNGAVLVNNASVNTVDFNQHTGLYTLEIDNDGPTSLQVPYVINAAGHGACALAATVGQIPAIERVSAHAIKGNYFRLDAPAPFKRLVYPVPEEGGLGVHITLDLAGQARFGPDVELIAGHSDTMDYAVDPSRADSFYEAIRSYWPALPDGVLQPDYAGMRPRVHYRNQLHNDFLILGTRQHGLPRLVNLFGVESPGLTASLAIADRVAQIINDA